MGQKAESNAFQNRAIEQLTNIGESQEAAQGPVRDRLSDIFRQALLGDNFFGPANVDQQLPGFFNQSQGNNTSNPSNTQRQEELAPQERTTQIDFGALNGGNAGNAENGTPLRRSGVGAQGVDITSGDTRFPDLNFTGFGDPNNFNTAQLLPFIFGDQPNIFNLPPDAIFNPSLFNGGPGATQDTTDGTTNVSEPPPLTNDTNVATPGNTQRGGLNSALELAALRNLGTTGGFSDDIFNQASERIIAPLKAHAANTGRLGSGNLGAEFSEALVPLALESARMAQDTRSRSIQDARDVSNSNFGQDLSSFNTNTDLFFRNLGTQTGLEDRARQQQLSPLMMALSFLGGGNGTGALSSVAGLPQQPSPFSQISQGIGQFLPLLFL